MPDPITENAKRVDIRTIHTFYILKEFLPELGNELWTSSFPCMPEDHYTIYIQVPGKAKISLSLSLSLSLLELRVSGILLRPTGLTQQE